MDPTYHNLADHTEVVDLEFDPTVIRFEELLELFWDGHNPTSAHHGKQYRAVLFCHSDDQQRRALASAEQVAERRRGPVMTAIELGHHVYAAEAYHQKWRLRRHPNLLDELMAHYRDEATMLASTTAAKLNAYLGGNGSREQLDRDFDRLGLSPEGQRYFEGIVGKRLRPSPPAETARA